ncbi:MAG TPA: SDR family NAD(P)-dependent oxidoreductase [Puia sp.]|nr:SDR family NAD(P)-dependent oxidoreductase [Puia sp.]
MKLTTIIGITPLEIPDCRLTLGLEKAGALPILHLGRDREAAVAAISEVTEKCSRSFGVCFTIPFSPAIELPPRVDHVVAPYGMPLSLPDRIRLFRQVVTVEEARLAKQQGAHGLIVKGNEGAGLVSDESSFILFQKIRREITETEIWVQGGAGIHSSAALAALGAAGVVLDSQLIGFDECSASRELKHLCSKLNGNETKVIDHFRVLVRPNSPTLPGNATYTDLLKWLGPTHPEKGYLPLGQDIAIAAGLVQQYKTLPHLVFAIRQAIHGHLRQAKALSVIAPGNGFARELHIRYPIAQGPMTRVSDVAAFAAAVADAGALPFIALSLLQGDKARQLIRETSRLAGDKTWGVGILGFVPPELREEQLACLLEEKPPVVLIAGGRPSQAKPLEAAGIKVFLHVPSPSLLDMFIKEGGRNFVFEGRECGGHVGPLSSLVLWETQIRRLLQEEDAGAFTILFAGGIHDAFSAAFVSVMAAPLVAKGARTGVLMGTAYLYTEEAVSTGAVVRQFQQQALEHSDTILLETAPGHETRCLRSPFADFFHQEKERLRLAGVDKQEIWAQLEKLNVGRLRMAAKGIERQDNALVEIHEDHQLTEGMYMIGQVVTLRDHITTIDNLHKEVAEENARYISEAILSPLPEDPSRSLQVAIIGMACIYPGARNIDEYWRNILQGKDCVTEVPDERWNKDLYYNPQANGDGKSNSKWGGFIPRIDFDPLEFGIPPQSLAAIEPTQLLTLLAARDALRNAGYADKEFDRENVSVIIAAEGGNDLSNSYAFRNFFTQVFGELPAALDAALPKMTEDSFPGILANVIAGRICNRLDLGGRNFSVDAACASSLAAVDLACQELQNGKADMVLAGAADLHNTINDYLLFTSTHALSGTGKCMTFDAAADGIALGEGIAMLVLKRYEDARRDGDTIYALIQGVGGSSDGKSLGLTAPRKRGQWKALERAYHQAGISPAAAGLIEAHGTGTIVGDKTELSALSDLFLQSGALAGQTSLGSVKTQIGHTKCAAGLAGLIKAALSIYHGVKPPTLHLKNPNRFYNPATSPFSFNTEAAPWNDTSRIAGVSAFGFGGTNFHAVLGNDPGSPADSLPSGTSVPALNTWPSELFVFRGDSYVEARNLLTTIRTILLDNDSIDLKDLAYSLYSYNSKPVQLSIVADSLEDFLLKLDLALSGASARGIHVTQQSQGKVAFLFAGQGSQRINMARDLFTIFPFMRRLLRTRPDYEKILFPPAVFDEAALRGQKEHIKDTRLAQPLLGVVDLAIACFLRELDIIPDMVAGHSYGELPALCFAGAFPEDQLIPLSEKRAQAILDSTGDDKGTMIAVNCPKEVLAAFTDEGSGIYPVNHNSPQQWVLAGATPDIEKLIEKLKAQKISFRQLEVACAFHSPLLAASEGLFTAAMKDIPFSHPAIPVWSNTTAGVYPSDPAGIRERLATHLVKPVRFAEEIANMIDAGARLFIEVGPGKVLSTLTRAIAGKDETILHTDEKDGITQLLSVIASYIATGRKASLEKLFIGRRAKLLDLDKPGNYKKSSTTWLVNGQIALPLSGPLPTHGALPIVQPIPLTNGLLFSAEPPASPAPLAGTAERIMEEYLNSIKFLVQAQRDVILGYLGQTPPITPVPMTAPLPASARPSSLTNSLPASARLSGLPPAAVQGTEIDTSPATPQNKALTQADLKDILLRIVSDKTGYPADMLGLDLDMEADLSIDSIKRTEIIGELSAHLKALPPAGEQEKNLEQLSSLKTLNGLLTWLSARLPTTAASSSTVLTSTAPSSVFPSSVTAVSATSIPAWTAEQITSLLLTTVSDKTGYPTDMLGMQMDMEADLSIDSIKKLEIIGALRTRLGVDRLSNNSEDKMTEHLTTIKTLEGLSGWFCQLLPVQTGSTGNLHTPISSNGHALRDTTFLTDTAGLTETTPLPASEKLLRLRFEWTPSSLRREDTARLQGHHFALSGDTGPIAAAIRNVLEEQGAIATIASETDDLGSYDGLILLDLFDSPLRLSILESFALIKKLDPGKVKWVYVLSDLNNHLRQQTDPQLLRRFQGYPGFLKSLGKEWEHTRCGTIHINNEQAPAHIAAILLDELSNVDHHSEVIYQDSVRQTAGWIPSELTIGQSNGLRLDKDAVVLVLGGAQGITAELMIRFSKEYPCHYILVGRSPDPGTGTPGPQPIPENKEDIRQWLIRQGELKSAADIERRAEQLFKSAQIRQTLQSLENNGATATYHSLDLRNEDELTLFISSLYKIYGRIDGVIHGAGLLEDKLFRHKTPESFERVFSTKVTPLRILAEQLRPDTGFVVLFSSVASVYGNRGQTDYAAANSVLDHYAWELKKKIEGRVLSINWGPWKGAGMVSPTLEKEYERRGISLIPLPEGIESFLNELKYGNESQILIMAEQSPAPSLLT